jgi:hypothetical protein
MKQLTRKCLPLSLLLFAFVSTARAADESFASQFLGNPLLVLAVLLAIDGIAFLYHKIRK